LINDQITDSKESRIRPFIASGTNTYTVTIPYVTSYLFGLTIYVQFSNANSGTSTINITGASGSPLGAKTLKKSVLTDLVTGDILAGEFKELWYDGTNFQVRGAGGGGGGSIVVSSNTTAVNDGVYTVVASATFTDPSPVEGKGFTVFIRNGTGTVGGTGYSVAGTEIRRVFHSGSWANYTGGGAISGLTSGRVVVATSGTTIGDDANLFWDGANKRLDLRTASGIRFQRNDNALNFEMGLIDPIATNDFVINAVTSPTGFQFQQGGVTVFGITNQQRFNFNNKIFFNTSTGSALADFQSTNQGLVLPRALRSAIISSENGMLTVDTNVPYFNNGTAWSAIPTAPTALGTSLQVLRTNAGGTATEWATISVGITNTAANNELMMSNGTNAVPSGVFADATGNLNLGTSLSGATRTISATGSATDIGLALQSKGSSAISFTGGGSNYQFGTGGFNFSTSGLAITGINTIQSGNTTTLNLLTPPQSGATNGTNVVIFTGDVVTGTSGNVNIYTGSNSGGTEGAVNIQTRATGKLGFFNATSVVKQSAVSTSQGIADVLTAYGLLPSSTISSGGTYYAPSTLVANATDANFTATLNGVHNILDGVASANRVITIPTGANGDVMKFFNTEDTYIWSFTGATVYLEDRVTVETELRYNVSCFMEKIDGRWIITN
jgi:hypothetical protein